MIDARAPHSPDPIELPAPALPSGRRIVVSDVHGCLRTLMAMLDRLGLTHDDQLFLVGDYVNKGPHSAEVIETLLKLEQDGYALFPLRGNHEQMWLDAADQGDSACQALADHQNASDLLDVHGRLHPRYRNFMAGLPLFVRLDKVLLVHGGFDFSLPDPFAGWREMLEIRDYPVDLSATGNRPIYHGHHPTPLAYIKHALASGSPHVSLDNGCVYYGEREDHGRLLAYDLNSDTLIEQPYVEHLQLRAFVSSLASRRRSDFSTEDILEHLGRAARLAHTLEQRFALERTHAASAYRDSLANLLHYIALRRQDLRPVQDKLGELGISRLGRTESHVMAGIQAVAANVSRLIGQPATSNGSPPTVSFQQGRGLLEAHAVDLLGPAASGRRVRIMVTLPSEAASDGEMVHDLIARGADAVRINCAHDEVKAWRQMIEHVREADRVLGRSTNICMDLAGPKLRTGPLVPGPEVVRLRPMRDRHGRTIQPFNVWIAPPEVPSPDDEAARLPAQQISLKHIAEGDTLRFLDARGKKRSWKVLQVTSDGVLASGLKTSYLVSNLSIKRRRGKRDRQAITLGTLPALEQPILLRVGDELILHRENTPGEPARLDKTGTVTQAAHVACTLPNVYTDARPGEPILFDDGRIEGIIRRVSADEMHIEITYARGGTAKLRSGKGINLPKTLLRLNGLTQKDREDLRFVAQHADVVNLSFVNEASDVAELYHVLDDLEAPPSLGVILKIETRRGVHNLPMILMTAMRRAPLGVMIARGDLAVECGWQHLAQVQEELLRVCEAAHVPIVWATQVLETAAKTGRPSRAEVTDAAMAQRAECVMLNKGPYIGEAVSMLDEILVTMRQIRQKKAPMLPALQLPDALIQEADNET